MNADLCNEFLFLGFFVVDIFNVKSCECEFVLDFWEEKVHKCP